MGIAKDPAKRAQQHGDRFDLLTSITTEPLSRRRARAIEQSFINDNPHFSIKINSTSLRRSWYDDAVEWGDNWRRKNGYKTD
ncbi:hypothetical protein NXZ84_04700 [Mechercharimyces sp. CAU 1602]|nr:hypothetical protein [Mechercharimyces sp. CAU 1602]